MIARCMSPLACANGRSNVPQIDADKTPASNMKEQKRSALSFQQLREKAFCTLSFGGNILAMELALARSLAVLALEPVDRDRLSTGLSNVSSTWGMLSSSRMSSVQIFARHIHRPEGKLKIRLHLSRLMKISQSSECPSYSCRVRHIFNDLEIVTPFRMECVCI